MLVTFTIIVRDLLIVLFTIQYEGELIINSVHNPPGPVCTTR